VIGPDKVPATVGADGDDATGDEPAAS
jgi:hypothetical protein